MANPSKYHTLSGDYFRFHVNGVTVEIRDIGQTEEEALAQAEMISTPTQQVDLSPVPGSVITDTVGTASEKLSALKEFLGDLVFEYTDDSTVVIHNGQRVKITDLYAQVNDNANN